MNSNSVFPKYVLYILLSLLIFLIINFQFEFGYNVNNDQQHYSRKLRDSYEIHDGVVSSEKEMRAGNLLVVGGTDGSGSRRVVQLLVALGVNVVSEDPETYDIHANVAGGWPIFVKSLLRVRSRFFLTPNVHRKLVH